MPWIFQKCGKGSICHLIFSKEKQMCGIVFGFFPFFIKNKPDLITKSRNFSSLNSLPPKVQNLKVCLDMDNVYALG